MHLPDIYLIPRVLQRAYWRICRNHRALREYWRHGAGQHGHWRTEIYQDGSQVPSMKLFDGGVVNDALIGLIETNSRMPSQLRGAYNGSGRFWQMLFITMVDVSLSNEGRAKRLRSYNF